ncbi:MAG: HAD family hydrolase [Mycoplasmatales bacterium]
MKILFSDLDGTLIQEKKIDETVIRKLYKWKSDKNMFVIATGREYTSVLHLKGLTNFDYSINCNGALIVDKNDDVVYASYIKPEVVEKVINLINDDFDVFVSDGFETIRVRTIEDLKLNNILFFSITQIDKCHKKVREFMKKLSDNKIQIGMTLNGSHLDLGPLEHTKATAIKILQKKLKINDEDIYVVGDQENDISMIKEYENSYAIKSGNQELKSLANNVVDNVGEIISNETFNIYK